MKWIVWLGGFVASGHAVDLILAVIGGEFVFLSWRGAARGGVNSTIDVFCALAPGACLLLALRAALTGAGWMWIAAFLSLSFPVHICDLTRRRLSRS
jgi:hypothetical protein